MNFLDFDFDRFAKAMNIQGFDLVMIVDMTGSIIVEKSADNVDRELLAEKTANIVQLALSVAEPLRAGALQTAAFEYSERKILLGISEHVIICGIPNKSTPSAYARNEIAHATKALM